MLSRMDFGVWTEDKKGSYNNYDAISRSTIEVLTPQHRLHHSDLASLPNH